MRGRFCSIVLAVLAGPLAAQQRPPVVSLSAGAEYSSGDYGGSGDVKDVYVPVRAAVDFDRFNVSLTVPYLWVKAPSGTVITGPDGAPVFGSGSEQTESGIGDVLVAGTVRDVWRNAAGDTVMDLSGRIKLGTADEDKGLGTGKTDYTMSAQFYRFAGSWTFLAAPGYTLRGDPSAFSLDNQWLFSTGASRRIVDGTRVGLFYDFRTSATDGADDIHELALHVSQQLSGSWRIFGFTFAGLTDSSPDWGVGVALEVRQ